MRVSWVDMIFRIECEITLCELIVSILLNFRWYSRWGLRGPGIEVGEEVRERKWDLNVQHLFFFVEKKCSTS